MPPLLHLQKLPGKGDGEWGGGGGGGGGGEEEKKVPLRRFLADQKIAILWGKKCVLGHPIAKSYCLLPDTF